MNYKQLPGITTTEAARKLIDESSASPGFKKFMGQVYDNVDKQHDYQRREHVRKTLGESLKNSAAMPKRIPTKTGLHITLIEVIAGAAVVAGAIAFFTSSKEK